MIHAKTEKSAAPFAADDADKIAFLYLPINSFLFTGKTTKGDHKGRPYLSLETGQAIPRKRTPRQPQRDVISR